MQCHECDAVLPPEARFCFSCGARLEPDAPDSTVDPLLETLKKAIGFQYWMERLLGRGGMGAVYLAHELALDRDVAIKVLPPEQASTPQMRERFRREARTAARLSHPHIVPLHTFGEVSGLVYFVMGYIAGESLASRLKRDGPFPPEEARTLLVAICDALDYAHHQGIVHRDIKPDNILIDTVSGAPLLTDFGIAKPALAEAQLTTTGQLIGTPHYMSPEQALGRADVDARSDVYSLGIVAYEMISGHRPFDAENPMDALTQRLTRDRDRSDRRRPRSRPIWRSPSIGASSGT
jgi:eukaryotic-like serine/threonine-protein kinase